MGRTGYGQLDWEEAVRESYRRSVTAEEFENKCATNPDALRKIAYYLKETGYSIIDLDVDNGRVEVAGLVQTMFDFLNFTDGV